LCISFSSGTYTFTCYHDGSYLSFTSGFRTHLSIFCKAGLKDMNSHSFCLSWKIFISPSFLKDSLAGYRNLGWQCFLFVCFVFQDLEYIMYFFLAFSISAEKYAIGLMGLTLNLPWCHSLADFKIISLSYTFDNLTIVCYSEDIFCSCLLGFYKPLNMDVHLFPKIREVFCAYNIYLLALW
jgi:hypothetical protein